MHADEAQTRIDPLIAMHGHALPGDSAWFPRDRDVATRHLRMELTLDVANKSLAGTATHHLVPLNDGLTAIELDAAEMTIEAVTVAGSDAPFSYDGARLRVEIEQAPPRGEEFRLAITYRATPRIGMYFVGPDEAYPDKPQQVWTQCQDEDAHHWVPCFDDPYGKQTSEMIATVPGDWFALSNGRLLEDRQNRNGTRTLHWLQDRPHSIYLLTLAAGVFTHIDATPDAGPTIDYYLEPGTEADGQRALQHTPEMVELFSDLAGMPFPWAKYSQIVVRDFVFGGMENTTATTMTELLLLDEKAAVDTTSDYLVAHELAHQWFGDLLTCRDWSHGWLNEGFATYLEAYWEQHHHGEDAYRQSIQETADIYFGEAGQFTRPIVSRVWNTPMDIFDRHLYDKGGLVLHMLRGVLGDDGFRRSIQRYVRTNQDRNVVTQHLMDAIEEETGRRLDWFFDQWVFRPGHPKLSISWSWDGNTKLATVTVRQTQSTDKGVAVFRAPVTIDFRANGVELQRYEVELCEREHRFVLPVSARPDYCRFDPEGRLVAEVKFEAGANEFIARLRDDAAPGRTFAAKQLGSKGSSSGVIEALEERVQGDAFWGVQAAAADALGELRTTAARDALIRCIGVAHPKARRAVVRALGRFRGDETVFAAIAPLAANDASWNVEAEALRSLGKLRAAGSYDTIVANMERRSWREVVHVGCLDGLAELRDERGLDRMLESARYGQPAQRRAAALRAASRLVAFFPDRKPTLADDIVGYLHDPDLRVRLAAAAVVGSLGQRQHAAALDAMAARELDGRAIKTARTGARTLRGAGGDGAAGLRDELDRLRREHAELQAAVETLRVRLDNDGSENDAEGIVAG